MNARTSARLAWSLWSVGLVVLVASITFSFTVGGGGVHAEVTQAVAFFAIGTAGLAVARRQPSSSPGEGTIVAGRLPSLIVGDGA